MYVFFLRNRWNTFLLIISAQGSTAQSNIKRDIVCCRIKLWRPDHKIKSFFTNNDFCSNIHLTRLSKTFSLKFYMRRSSSILGLWLWKTRHIAGNNPSLCAYYQLRLTHLDFTHQELPHPSVSVHFSQPSWGHVNATLHQARQLVDYTLDRSTRLLHYLHIKLQISWTDQQWSSGCPHSFFMHPKEDRIF